MIASATLPGRPPPRPTGIAPFVPPVLPEDAAARYQARCEALGASDEAPIPDALPVHPSANDYPMLSLGELRALAADIAEKGLQRKIVLHNGQVVDGRNRLAASLLGGVPPQFEPWAGRGGSVDAFIESENDRRRHSSPTVRAAVAAFRAQRLLGDGPSPLSVDKALKKAAESTPGAGIYGTRTLFQAAQKTPEVLDLARKGQLSIEEAKRLRGMPEAEREKAVDAIKAGAAASDVVPPAAPRPRQPPPLTLAPPPSKGKPRPADPLNGADRKAGRSAISHLDNVVLSLRLAADELTSPAFQGERSSLAALEARVQAARLALRTRARPAKSGPKSAQKKPGAKR